MKTKLYVVKDLFSGDFCIPFVADSDREALTIFYNKIYSMREVLTSGFREYSYNLYCLGELDPGVVTSVSFIGARLVGVSNFFVEEEN